MAYLVIRKRGRFQNQVALGTEPKTLGRPGADITVGDDPKLPPVLASFALEGRSCRLVDRSGQGTRVDGKLVREALLPDGAKAVFGDFEVTFALQVEGALDDPSAARTEVDPAPLFELPRDLWVIAERAGDPASRREVKLGEGLEIGSGQGCGLRLDSPLVSKRHATLRRHGSLLMLHDPGSTNGTWYQTARVGTLAIPLNARFRVGPFEVWAGGPPEKETGRVRTFHGMRSGATVMFEVFREIERVGPLANAVAIHAETGCGKELVARALHACSDRAGGPFEVVNCAELDNALAGSELFGHAKGAFTGADKATLGAFQRAHGGTLFLDEVADLKKEVQSKLLRVLEEKRVRPVGSDETLPADVRIVVASNARLEDEVKAGRFRADLFWRLHRASIKLPPLRDRPGDVLALFYWFLGLEHPDPPTLTPDAIKKLLAHRWPGNVRELLTVVELALAHAIDEPAIDARHLVFVDLDSPVRSSKSGKLRLGDRSLRQMEAASLVAALEEAGGNRSLAARRLGIPRTTLLSKLKEHGLERAGLADGEEGK